MQKTYAQDRAEMKARLADSTIERLAKEQEIRVGKAFFYRGYSFEVISDSELETVISVRHNGRPFRTASYWKSGRYFSSINGGKLTDSLLKALCLTFVNFTTVNTKSSMHLLLNRACVYQASFRIQNGYGRKMVNPFGV